VPAGGLELAAGRARVRSLYSSRGADDASSPRRRRRVRKTRFAPSHRLPARELPTGSQAGPNATLQVRFCAWHRAIDLFASSESFNKTKADQAFLQHINYAQSSRERTQTGVASLFDAPADRRRQLEVQSRDSGVPARARPELRASFAVRGQAPRRPTRSASSTAGRLQPRTRRSSRTTRTSTAS
jgi:hypothetical protein